MRGDERLIIILGMAHSGTTILAYVLKQHPDILCCANGNESNILENDYLVSEDTESIQRLLDTYPQRILLKRPWSEVWHAGWLRSEMPNARYIYCYRGFREIAASWAKPGSMVSSDLRGSTLDHRQEYYNYCWDRAEEFASSVSNFYWHFHPTFVHEHPSKGIIKVANWLELSPWKFDTTMVSKCFSIKDIIAKEKDHAVHQVP